MAGALALADSGWPVVPGTFWQGRRWAGSAAAPQAGAVPIPADGPAGATCDTSTIIRWWSELPYSVLLQTGSLLDAIEVSPAAGRRLSACLRAAGVVAPAGTSSAGRWWFLVRAGEPLRPELAARPDVTLHGRGSWIVAPPSQDAYGAAQWCVPPPATAASAPTVPSQGGPPATAAAATVPAASARAAAAARASASARAAAAARASASARAAAAALAPSAVPAARAARSKPATILPDTYDVQSALLEVLGQRSTVAAAGAARAHRWP
jgi:hypothetical protein